MFAVSYVILGALKRANCFWRRNRWFNSLVM